MRQEGDVVVRLDEFRPKAQAHGPEVDETPPLRDPSKGALYNSVSAGDQVVANADERPAPAGWDTLENVR